MSELLGGKQRLPELMPLMKETSETAVWICSHWELQGCTAGKATLGFLRKGVSGHVRVCVLFFLQVSVFYGDGKKRVLPAG